MQRERLEIWQKIGDCKIYVGHNFLSSDPSVPPHWKVWKTSRCCPDLYWNEQIRTCHSIQSQPFRKSYHRVHHLYPFKYLTLILKIQTNGAEKKTFNNLSLMPKYPHTSFILMTPNLVFLDENERKESSKTSPDRSKV